MSEKPKVVVVINDLIFESKIRASAAAAGAEVQVIRVMSDLERLGELDGCRLVLIDLNTASEPIDSIRRALDQGPNAKLVAFVSHVDAALADAARNAGAHEVFPRSRFVAELPRLLAEAVDKRT